MTLKRKSRWIYWALLLIVLATSLGYGWYFNGRETDLTAYQSVAVSRGELVQIVTASGTLTPVVKVEVGSQISGIIQKLSVDFNSTVRENQVIAQIDPATYQANLIQAEGNLANAKAAAELNQLNEQRAKILQADRLTAKAEYERAVADLHQAEAAVKISEGLLKKAQVDLARCTIYAPIDGIVISRNVNVGQTVAASLSAPILFVIANDLTKMQIEADVAEADIGQVAVNQDVEFTVDAFPGQTFHGKVTQVRNAPKSELGVVTYVTIIEVTNRDLKLKPGMTANVSVIVARRDQALKIPGAALRFRLPKTAEAKKTEAPSGPSESKSDKKSSGGSRKKEKDKRKSERTVYVASAQVPAVPGAPVNHTPRAVPIKTGISDGRDVEVLEGLKEGDQVIVGLHKSDGGRTKTFNPFAFGAR